VVAPVRARSVSRPVWERLQAGRLDGRIAAAFEHTILLEAANGDLVALVTPAIGDGPLNIVLEASDLRGSLRSNLGGLVQRPISLEGAAIWEPCPDWPSLRAGRGALAPHLARLRELALECAPEPGLLALLGAKDLRGSLRSNLGGLGFLDAARKAAECLRAGWECADATQMSAGAAGLAGLGPGLTPAGDDWLCGLMIWAWLAHADPAPLCLILSETAAPRTTALSAALLRRAAQGECSAPWHRLLAALQSGSDGALRLGVQALLAQGHTSGADALAGFLYLPCRPP